MNGHPPSIHTQITAFRMLCISLTLTDLIFARPHMTRTHYCVIRSVWCGTVLHRNMISIANIFSAAIYVNWFARDKWCAARPTSNRIKHQSMFISSGSRAYNAFLNDPRFDGPISAFCIIYCSPERYLLPFLRLFCSILTAFSLDFLHILTPLGGCLFCPFFDAIVLWRL